MAKKKLVFDKGQGRPVGRFKNSARSVGTGPKSPGQRRKSPRGRMKGLGKR